MAESAHYQQLGKFVILFQELENSLIEFIGAISDEDYAAEILPAETEYPRLVGSTDGIFSLYIDRLPEPDLEAKKRFHELMKKCLDIGVLRNRLIRSTYALLVCRRDVVALEQENAKLKCEGGARRQAIAADPSVESFEPYFKRIAAVLAELRPFRLQVMDWKPAGEALTARSPAWQ